MPKNVRILIDGFPRQVTRWNVLKESIKDLWQPSKSSFAIILNVDRQMANQRFVDRGRQGDVFEKRFNQYMGTIGEIVGAMKRDGMTVMELSTGDGLNAHDTVHELERLPPWMENIGEGKKK
ncbi:hypothetical protein B0J11DRAFT_614297 [Dendryphion nanum]|uniref:Uncharacterized protein n=1 Tax=Dendryphion nanum TaxID=256645 RepID=A0A9P9IND3_9PLEO|nr:hypothetical protein B0J11DRAFT_614297 [Dendryphion nanum]